MLQTEGREGLEVRYQRELQRHRAEHKDKIYETNFLNVRINCNFRFSPRVSQKQELKCSAEFFPHGKVNSLPDAL